MNKEELNKANSYKPTQAMINNAKRGLALREKWKRGGLNASQAKEEGIGSGVVRASNIINGNLSLSTVKRMNSFFARHEKNYQPSKKESDGGPTAGTIAWLQWGGSAGKAWARSILRKEGLTKSVENTFNGVLLSKSVNEEKREATFLVLEPQDDDGTTSDLHLDWYDKAAVEDACRNFNAYCMRANLLHLMPTTVFKFVESYVAPVAFSIGDKDVKQGSWLATIKVDASELGDEVWQGIKSKKYNGLSVQAMGLTEVIED